MFKNKKLTTDERDELQTQQIFLYAEQAIEEKRYDLAYEHLKHIADEVHYEGTKMRGKAKFQIYKLARDGKLDFLNLKEDDLEQLLKDAANSKYQAAVDEQENEDKRFIPFSGLN